MTELRDTAVAVQALYSHEQQQACQDFAFGYWSLNIATRQRHGDDDGARLCFRLAVLGASALAGRDPQWLRQHDIVDEPIGLIIGQDRFDDLHARLEGGLVLPLFLRSSQALAQGGSHAH